MPSPQDTVTRQPELPGVPHGFDPALFSQITSMVDSRVDARIAQALKHKIVIDTDKPRPFDKRDALMIGAGVGAGVLGVYLYRKATTNDLGQSTVTGRPAPATPGR